MSFDPHALKIHVDGSALKNPGGAGGVAGWVEFPIDWNRPHELLFQEGFQETTNNRMELRACIRAFEHVRSQRFDPRVQRIIIVTDSKYVHDFLPNADGWRQNNWRNFDGKPVENEDLWKALISIRNKVSIRTEVKWMAGKKLPISKLADKAAKAAASQPWSIDYGFRGGKVGRSRVAAKDSASMFLAKGEEETIRIYRNRRAGRSEHKIYFTVFSHETGQFKDKAFAFTAPEIAIDLHRHYPYRVIFNANPKYPIIERMIEELPLAWPKQTTT
jgi:ribonuclease HI